MAMVQEWQPKTASSSLLAICWGAKRIGTITVPQNGLFPAKTGNQMDMCKTRETQIVNFA